MAQNRFTPRPFPGPPPAETNPYPTSAAAPGAHPDELGFQEDFSLEDDTVIGSIPEPSVSATPSPSPSPQRQSQPHIQQADPEHQRRLAALAGLSLDKDPQRMMPTQPFTPVSRSSKLPWFLLALVSVGGGIYIATRSPEQGPPVTAPAVATNTNQTASYGELVTAGYIAAKAPIVLAASSGARLTEVRVDTGDRVEKGQIVAVIDAGSLRAELRLANARLNAAQKTAKRARTLLNAGAGTASELDTALSQVNIEAAQVGVMKQKLDETQIRSPLTGTVLEVLARAGESLKAPAGESPGIMRIADLSALVAETDISEADLKQIHLGQPAEVSTDAQRGQIYKGTVREISEQADRSRGTVLVKIYIDPVQDSVLKPGMAIQVRFIKPKEAAPGSIPDGTGTPKAIDTPTQPPATGLPPTNKAPATTSPATPSPATVVPTQPAKRAPAVNDATTKAPVKRKPPAKRKPAAKTKQSLPDL